jgi:hypothetical protein
MKILVIGPGGAHCSKVMTFDGHYDADADVASLRFERYDPATAVPEKTDYGFRELDIAHRKLVGLNTGRPAGTCPLTCWRCCPRPNPRQ